MTPKAHGSNFFFLSRKESDLGTFFSVFLLTRRADAPSMATVPARVFSRRCCPHLDINGKPARPTSHGSGWSPPTAQQHHASPSSTRRFSCSMAKTLHWQGCRRLCWAIKRKQDRVVDATADRNKLRMELVDGERRFGAVARQVEQVRSTMSGPMEQDQSSQFPASDLRWQNSQATMHCTVWCTPVAQKLGVGGVARVAAGAGCVESVCVRDIKSRHSRGSRSVEDCCFRIAPRAQCIEEPTRQEIRGRERSFVRDGHCDRRHRSRSEVTKFSIQSVLIRDARYGLRGVRIGEAAHPGPPKLILRGVQANRFRWKTKCLPQCPRHQARWTLLARHRWHQRQCRCCRPWREPVCRVELESPHCLSDVGVGWCTISW